jgi:hypothetical protein
MRPLPPRVWRRAEGCLNALQPCNRPECPTALLFGTRRALRARGRPCEALAGTNPFHHAARNPGHHTQNQRGVP